MASKVNHGDKVLSRIDRLDRESVHSYVTGLLCEKKQGEEILDRIEEGVLLLEPQGLLRYANRNAFLWLGFPRFFKRRTRIEELVEEPSIRQFFLECLKHPLNGVVDEFRLLAPREIYMRVHWMPLELDEEKLVLVRLVNLTEEKNRSEEEARLERIDSLIRLAAGVAHEIGNPLNSIQIHIELLKREAAGLPKAKQKSMDKLINVIASETKRLDQIVRSFLRATRNPPLRFRLESLNEIVEEAVELLRLELKKGKIRLKLTLDKSLPQFLLDRDRLHQAFINLIKNGMQAMPQGGELTISTLRKERLCLVRFEDRGRGIDEKDLPHIFEAYYTTKEEGSGLGLTQVYQAVREHGGRIDVKSTPGKGSAFTLILPIRRERLSLPQLWTAKEQEPSR